MLVLTRKLDQSIAVGGGVTGFENLLKITVLGFSHGSVRLGFEVDGSVPVNRWEVWEKIQAGTAMPRPKAIVALPPISPGCRPVERRDPSIVL